MSKLSCGLAKCAAALRPHHPEMRRSAVRLVLLAALCISSWTCGMARAAETLEQWRGNASGLRIMAENDAPAARAEAERLLAGFPPGAQASDRVRVLNAMTRAEIYMALTEQASAHANQALEIARQNADRIGQAEANLNIALNAINEGRMDAISTAPAASLELLEGADRPDLLNEALLRMAMVYHRRGQLDESITMSMQAMEIARRANHPLSLVYAHQGLGISFGQTTNFKEALEHYLRMREQARLVPSKMLEAYAVLSIGTSSAALGDIPGGEAYIRQAMGMFRAIGAPFGLNHARYSLADHYRKLGRHAEALALFSETAATYEKYPNKIGLWYSLMARSREYMALGNRTAALSDAERAFSIAKDIGHSLYLTDNAQLIASVHAANGDYRRAYELSKEAAALINKSAAEKMSARVVELAQRYETEAKRRQIEELTRRNEQQNAELKQRELEQRLLWTVLVGSVAILAGTIFFLLRLRRSHAIIRELNASLEQRVHGRTAELRQQTRYLRTLIDALPWWVWLKDTQSRYLAVNQAAADASGLRKEALVGKSDRDILPPAAADAFHADDLEVMNSRCSKIIEEQQQLPGGTVWMETFKAPVLDEDGTVLGTVGFARDISERKAVEAAREAALAEAQRVARLRSDFLAQISHELRTPLNGILGYAQILRRDRNLDGHVLDGLNVIQQSGEHLLTLINDILDSAKIEAGKLELYPADVPLARLLRLIAGMIAVKADQKGIEFVSDIAPDLPAVVRADEKRLRQVLLNLLANAIKFTDRGQVTLRVRPAPAGRLRFEVQDSGIGIGEDQMREIFQPFAQTGEVQRRFGGTGLGLAISRQFVQLMGGDIRVESRVGEGSLFWFELELPVVHAELATERAESGITGYRGPRKSILVVDDIAENRAVAIEMLEQLGFAMHEAADGNEALEKAQQLRPDLVLMDIILPGMDGLETTQRLRRLPDMAELPVIAVSASATDEDKKRCMAMNVNGFLPKPLVLEELLNQVGAVLKLEWIAETGEQAAQADGLPALPVEAPPRHEMEILHRLARIGNMEDIVQRAIYLRELDERYRRFADHLSMLARSYQSKAILKFVQVHLKD